MIHRVRRKKVTLPCGTEKKEQHLQCLSALTALFMIITPDQQAI